MQYLIELPPFSQYKVDLLKTDERNALRSDDKVATLDLGHLVSRLMLLDLHIANFDWLRTGPMKISVTRTSIINRRLLSASTELESHLALSIVHKGRQARC